ncbi:hypothetical protein NFI96_027419 [Prochilodus magdalenae]|nr:hypothetical protein NFI96_027419 [Prochilodus magdalenae]
MISRYSRRPVAHSLQIRGVSRSNLDQHPLPEQPEPDPEEPPPSHSSSETSSVASGRSGCPVDSARSWSGIHSYPGTGVSTERSSLFSWGYDAEGSVCPPEETNHRAAELPQSTGGLVSEPDTLLGQTQVVVCR